MGLLISKLELAGSKYNLPLKCGTIFKKIKTAVILHTAMIVSTKPHPYQFKRNGYILQLLTVKWKHRFPIGNFHCML